MMLLSSALRGCLRGKPMRAALLLVTLLGIITTVPAPATADTVRMLLRHNYFPEAYDDIKSRFEAAYPGDSVVFTTGEAEDSDEHLGLVKNLLSTGDTTYDLFHIDVIWPGMLGEFFDDLVAAGVDPGVVGQLLPAAVSADRVGGRQVALPLEIDLGLLYYRHDVLADFGYGDAELPPRTWEELYAIAKDVQTRLRAADPVGNADVWGFDTQLVENEGLTCIALETVYTNGGGTVIDTGANGTRSDVTIDNELAYAGLERLRSWIGDIVSPAALTQRAGGSSNRFRRGGSVFMRNWSFAIAASRTPFNPCQPELLDLTGKVTVAPMPADVPERQAGTLGGWQMGLSKFSTRKVAAANLINFLYSTDTQNVLASYGFPITRMELYAPNSIACNVTGLCQEFATVARFSSLEGYLQKSADFQRAVTKVLTNDATAKESMEELAAMWLDSGSTVVVESSGDGAVVGGVVAAVVVVFAAAGFLAYRRQMSRKVTGALEINREMNDAMTSLVKVSEITFGDELGKGAYGVVFRGRWRGITVAVKKIVEPTATPPAAKSASSDSRACEMSVRIQSARTAAGSSISTSLGSRVRTLMSRSSGSKSTADELSEADMEFHAEIALFCQLRHPNIVLYLGSTDHPRCIIMEFMPKGELHQMVIDSDDRLPWPMRLRMTHDIALGMRYLHEHEPQVLHCDLKPQNVLLDEHFNAKICDFGLGAMGKDLTNTGEAVGSLFYMSPEVMEGSFYPASDVYSFSMVMYEMLTAKPIYWHMAGKIESAMEIAYQVLDDSLRPLLPTSEENKPAEFMELMTRAWAQDHTARPSFAVISEELERMKELAWARKDKLMKLSEYEKILEIVHLRKALAVYERVEVQE